MRVNSMKSMHIEIKTLTQIWTGGVKGKCDILHETGIIGSMRWWYEAIVRAVGGWACDPSKHQCKDGNLCDVCLVFGTTGLKRSFRINLEYLQNKYPDQELIVKVNNNRGWYLGCGFYSEKLEGDIVPIRSMDCINTEELYQILALTLQLAAKCGGLGSRTQQGYGVMEIKTIPKLKVDKALEALQKCIQSPEKQQTDTERELPRLDEFFFAKLKFPVPKKPLQFISKRVTDIRHSNKIKSDERNRLVNEFCFFNDNQILPIAPIVRYHLRGLIRNNIQYISKYGSHPNSAARWRLMGVLNGRYHKDDFGKVTKLKQNHWNCSTCKKKWNGFRDLQTESKELNQLKSLIHVSNAYPISADKYEFRIWGWVPPTLPGDVQRNNILNKLKKWVGGNGNTGILWNKIHCNIDDISVKWLEIEPDQKIEDYLRSLLTEEVLS